MSDWLGERVQGFFAKLNWDNRPIQTQPHQPLAWMRVASVLNSIPWHGDPEQLSGQSLQQATPENWLLAEAEDDQPFTLSDLSSLF